MTPKTIMNMGKIWPNHHCDGVNLAPPDPEVVLPISVLLSVKGSNVLITRVVAMSAVVYWRVDISENEQG